MKRKIRVILTKKGYNVLLKVIKDWDKNLLEVFINDKTCKKFGNVVLIKWDDNGKFKSYETLIMLIQSYNITYRICLYKEGIIQMMKNTERKDERKNIPMPCIRCSFQDEKTEKLLSKFQNKTVKGDDENGI